MPNVELNDIKWNEDQRALNAFMASFGYRYPASGQVVASKLRLRYDVVTMPNFVGQREPSPSAKPEKVRRVCNAILSVNDGRDSLEETLSCEDMPQALQVRMPLG